MAHELIKIRNATLKPIPLQAENFLDAVRMASDDPFGEGIELSTEQKRAILECLTNNITIITGGPGTGKTTIINTLVKLFDSAGFSVALAAPTGRAAKRMEEASGKPAMTIHRLLDLDDRSDADGRAPECRERRNAHHIYRRR